MKNKMICAIVVNSFVSGVFYTSIDNMYVIKRNVMDFIAAAVVFGQTFEDAKKSFKFIEISNFDIKKMMETN